MFDRSNILRVAEYVHENHIAISDQDAVENALVRIVPESYDMTDEARHELVAEIVAACESRRPDGD
jgi:hypothetical protein